MPNTGAKIERKYMAHFINSAVPGETAVYERLGKDLEEYNIEMNANTSDNRNILGEVNVIIDSYAPTADAEPYYARYGTGLFTRLQNIVDNRLVLDDLLTDVVEVHLWEEETSGAYPAYKEVAYIEPTSYGGDTTGYQIPFTVHYTGERTAGTFNPTTKTFTAAA